MKRYLPLAFILCPELLPKNVAADAIIKREGVATRRREELIKLALKSSQDNLFTSPLRIKIDPRNSLRLLRLLRWLAFVVVERLTKIRKLKCTRN